MRTQWYMAVLLVPLLALAAALLWGWRGAARAEAAAAGALHAQQVLTALAALRGDALQADVDAAEAQAGGAARLAQLRGLLAGEPAAYSQLVALGPLLGRRVEAAAGAAAAARPAVADARRLQALFDAAWQPLQQAALDRAAATRQAAAEASDAAPWAAVLPGALALLLLAAAAATLYRWQRVAVQAGQRAARAAVGEGLARGALQQLLQADPAALCVLDAEGRIVVANAGCAALWGRPAEALVGHAFLDHLLPEDQRRTQRAWNDAQQQPGSVQRWRSTALHADGSRRPVDWQAVYAEAQLVCAGHDAGALVAAQQQAQAAGAALRAGRAEHQAVAARADVAERLNRGFIPALHARLAPLAPAIASAAGILLQGLAGPLTPEQRREAARIAEHAAALQARLATALDLARLEAGTLPLDNGAFDVWEAVNAVGREAAAAAQDKGLKFELLLADDLGYARGDATRVAQVLRELLANAVRCTPAGSVALQAALAPPGRLRLAVRDSGPGVADDAALFEPFAAAGMGLALARGLARRMGGDVAITPGRAHGSEFVFTLPADTLTVASDALPAA